MLVGRDGPQIFFCYLLVPLLTNAIYPPHHLLPPALQAYFDALPQEGEALRTLMEIKQIQSSPAA